ncbi:hypothetical protein P3G55_21915 [Leptospira sp. 96542]|nr:hypothetical protein [Leptospira sp. 96542]
MDAHGTFILRTPPVMRRDATGALICADFKVGEPARAPTQGWTNEFVARWKGPGVESFCAIHADELRAGRGLRIDFDRVRHDELLQTLVVRVTALDLAPLAPSWKKHAATIDGARNHDTPEPTEPSPAAT